MLQGTPAGAARRSEGKKERGDGKELAREGIRETTISCSRSGQIHMPVLWSRTDLESDGRSRHAIQAWW